MNTVKIESLKTKMIAHRGLSGIERENTNPAFVAAGNRSYYGIETDVHVTKDGKFVVIHDETTERVTLGEYNINVEENNYSEVENIVLPDFDGTTMRKDIRIPLLTEYINICKKYEKVCVLEVKNHFIESDLERMVEEIRETGYLENVIFISFDLENCINLRKLLPENKIQFLVANTEITDALIEILYDHKLDLDINYRELTKKIIKTLHSKGIEVNCWTCDDKTAAEDLAKMGVDYITTNILE